MIRYVLALSIPWNETMGVEDGEETYIPFMKKKQYIIDIFNYNVISEETYDFYEQNRNKTLLSIASNEKLNWNVMIPGNVNINMNLYKLYTYKERTFGNVSNSFNLFTRKVKKYYANKLKSYKNPRNILSRQIKGRY